MRRRLILMTALLVLGIAVACSDDSSQKQPSSLDSPLTTIASTSGTQPPVQVVGELVSGVGPGLSVADAIASTLEGPLLVNGFIFTTADEVRLCTSLPREEYPTCGEPSIEVQGFDPTILASYESLEGIGWTNETVQVLGVKIDDVLTVSGTMLAQ